MRLSRRMLFTGFGLIALAPIAAHAQGERGYPPVPALREEMIPPPPRERMLWEPGHWHWNGGQYVWIRGHYIERGRFTRWEHGHWEIRGGVQVWVPGHWV